MSIWKPLAQVATAISGGGLGAKILSLILGPQDAAGCRIAMGVPGPLDFRFPTRVPGPLDFPFPHSTVTDPCLNKLGVMAGGLDPDFLTFSGAIVGIVILATVKWLRSREA